MVLRHGMFKGKPGRWYKTQLVFENVDNDNVAPSVWSSTAMMFRDLIQPEQDGVLMMSSGRTRVSVSLSAFALLGCDSTSPVVATHLTFESQPSASVVSTQPLGNVRVTVLSAAGQVVTGTGYRVTMSLSASDAAAQLAGTTTVETTTGVATFPDLAIARAGADFRLVASVTGLESAESRPFVIIPGPASQLRFDPINPSPIPVASDLPAVVRITDAGGNPVPDATNPVTLSSTRTGPFGMSVATDGLFGPATQAAVNGVVTFSGLTIHKSGGYTLSATSPGLSGTTSGPFTVQAAAMTRLIFVTQPSDGTAGTPLAAFSVQQVDDYGNGLSLPPGPSYSATLSMGNNPTGAALGGTLTVSGLGVTALTFKGVSLDKPGTGYTLVATSDGRTLTSTPFSVH